MRLSTISDQGYKQSTKHKQKGKRDTKEGGTDTLTPLLPLGQERPDKQWVSSQERMPCQHCTTVHVPE
eukprot:12085111-Ditylum_brightwellii.AAC.1